MIRFGPDGRLYVAEIDGLIKAYTIARNAATDTYAVTNTETIDLIQQIPNHDDNGTLNPTVTTRLVTGLVVTGTAEPRFSTSRRAIPASAKREPRPHSTPTPA